MTRDEAIERLRQCVECKRWITTMDCDHCWVDRHKCPTTLTKALDDLSRAVTLGDEARRLRERLQQAFPELKGK